MQARCMIEVTFQSSEKIVNLSINVADAIGYLYGKKYNYISTSNTFFGLGDKFERYTFTFLE